MSNRKKRGDEMNPLINPLAPWPWGLDVEEEERFWEEMEDDAVSKRLEEEE